MSEPSRGHAATEVAALLASPPPWLDLDDPHDTELSSLDYQRQRGRGPQATKLAWRWTCAIRAPEGSPYRAAEGSPDAVSSYRVLVRFPMGYPLLPLRLHVLSVMHHVEVDLRDPFEGQLDDLFYEKLAERASRAGPVSTVEAAPVPDADETPLAGGAQAEADREVPAKRARLEASAGAVEPSWLAPEPRFSLRDALELFEAMLRGPLESEPTAQERDAWEAVAARHAETLTDAAAYRAGALHSQLFGARLQPGWLALSFAAALDAGPEALRAHAEEVAPGVFAFDMLSVRRAAAPRSKLTFSLLALG